MNLPPLQASRLAGDEALVDPYRGSRRQDPGVQENCVRKENHPNPTRKIHPTFFSILLPGSWCSRRSFLRQMDNFVWVCVNKQQMNLPGVIGYTGTSTMITWLGSWLFQNKNMFLWLKTGGWLVGWLVGFIKGWTTNPWKSKSTICWMVFPKRPLWFFSRDLLHQQFQGTIILMVGLTYRANYMGILRSRLYHQRIQVPNLEVLYLIFVFFEGGGFPYP